ncbi:hypothetical protein ACFPN7_09925 [Amycolatopsis halotolerans]|uniref:hypothetical protein n=1 Tax=Amycolatopsis halotolerans TaxID=330083 RepID=UPI00360FDC4B
MLVSSFGGDAAVAGTDSAGAPAVGTNGATTPAVVAGSVASGFETDSPADRGVPGRKRRHRPESAGPLRRKRRSARNILGPGRLSAGFPPGSSPDEKRWDARLSQSANTAARGCIIATQRDRSGPVRGTGWSSGEASRPTRCATGAICFSERVRPVVPDALLGKHEGAECPAREQDCGGKDAGGERIGRRRGAVPPASGGGCRDRTGRRSRSGAGAAAARGGTAPGGPGDRRTARAHEDWWNRWRLRS